MDELKKAWEKRTESFNKCAEINKRICELIFRRESLNEQSRFSIIQKRDENHRIIENLETPDSLENGANAYLLKRDENILMNEHITTQYNAEIEWARALRKYKGNIGMSFENKVDDFAETEECLLESGEVFKREVRRV